MVKMLVGVPKEIKNNEFRVGLTPESVNEITKLGHKVIVENNLGTGIGKGNIDYIQAGATIIESAKEIFNMADIIIKVKEPQPIECEMLRENQILFTYLHLAASLPLTKAIMASKCVAIAYETVTDINGKLPLLAPMSEVAGKIAVQMGAFHLLAFNRGKGILIGGVPGTIRGKIVIIGAGMVGETALQNSIGLGAEVTILDTSLPKLRMLDLIYGNKITTLYSNFSNILNSIQNADIIISSVLIPGEKAPKLITKDMLKKIQPGSVLVDVAIDQGGSTETSKPTTHENPTFVVNDVIHYCVTNMPGIVPKTSSYALNNSCLPFIKEILSKGLNKSLQENTHLLNGLNVYKGLITNKSVAKSLNQPYSEVNF